MVYAGGIFLANSSQNGLVQLLSRSAKQVNDVIISENKLEEGQEYNITSKHNGQY